MAIDQATADYDREQAQRAALQDDWAECVEREQPQSTSSPIPKVCPQCVNWKPEQALVLMHLADGSTRPVPGYCAVRAAADLPQMSKEYAERCRFYEEKIPF